MGEPNNVSCLSSATPSLLTWAIARSTTGSPSLAPAGIKSFASSAQSIAHRCMRFCSSGVGARKKRRDMSAHAPLFCATRYIHVIRWSFHDFYPRNTINVTRSFPKFDDKHRGIGGHGHHSKNGDRFVFLAVENRWLSGTALHPSQVYMARHSQQAINGYIRVPSACSPVGRRLPAGPPG